MKVIILWGGMGIHLREETEYKPKPMMEIGGKPILWHIMKHYVHYGFKDFILALGYKGDVIRNYFLNFYKYNSDFTVDLANNGNVMDCGMVIHLAIKATIMGIISTGNMVTGDTGMGRKGRIIIQIRMVNRQFC